jgi:hypothetical protein
MKTQTRKYKLKNRKTKRGGYSLTTPTEKPAPTNTVASNTALKNMMPKQAALTNPALEPPVKKGFFNGWFKSKDTFNVDANKSIDNLKEVFKTKDLIINDNMTITEIKKLIPPVSE